MLILVGLILLLTEHSGRRREITYGQFRAELARKNIAKVDLQGSTIYGEFKSPPKDPLSGEEGPSQNLISSLSRDSLKFVCEIPQPALADSKLDQELLAELGPNYKATEPADNTVWLSVVYLAVTIGLFVGLWLMFRRARDQVFGGGILSGFIKSPAKRYQATDKKVTFKDVAGLENVKAELEEIVEFLKNPQKFQRLGAKVPKGVLLMGPPGTGKTLLGRAVAGEANVPFFFINGSEFIQMFVGVGASRVRDLFATAKENAPSILFIDEIDAVGRHRGAGLGGGHDEREQTLNQILSEMDGFSQNDSVIVMAATNRPDILDPALLRPGRFDRHITVDRPNAKGRRAIFEVHTRDVPLAEDVDLDRLAAGTVGLTGADIRNLVNEAALWATRQGKDKVDMSDFEYARDKILMGPKREEVLTGKEKSMTAYHEAGHALLAWLVPGLDRLHKVSIIPRGRALGATQLLPQEDRVNIGQRELETRLMFLLGGRAAEKLVFDEYSAGAEDDLKRATSLARRMVVHWGMSERIGPMAFRHGEEHPFLGKEMAEPREYSEHTAQIIDEEIARILREAEARAKQLLLQHREKLDLLAAALEKEETLDETQIEELLGPPVYRTANNLPQEKAFVPALPIGTRCPSGDGKQSDSPPALPITSENSQNSPAVNKDS
ncbi:MAG: ATP-dependent zinc metalloprotease FtsH [Thermoguttaceae bacterium]|nr:ATP-dependent zinc metalloprotease FtsH [Thermoguttaceae bacterium]MDW8037982.1 ATP-dependent zinc metalloprotease FtsH [Thermoguttaceae bacterium]